MRPHKEDADVAHTRGLTRVGAPTRGIRPEWALRLGLCSRVMYSSATVQSQARVRPVTGQLSAGVYGSTGGWGEMDWRWVSW